MPLSIDELFGIPQIYLIDLSSDGRTLLYSTDISGVTHLHVYEIEPGSKPKQITHGNDPVTSGFLSPSGDQVLYLKDKDGNALHHMFLASTTGRGTKQITRIPRKTFDACWNPNGKEVARCYATKESCGIEVSNIETGAKTVLVEQENPFYGAAYSHDGKWIASTEYGCGKDPRNMQVTILKRSNPKDVVYYKIKDGSKEVCPSWSPDDKKLAFYTDSKGRNQVVIQDFKGRERIFLGLKRGEEAVDAWQMQKPYWNAKGDAVFYAVSKNSRTRLYKHSLDGERTELPFPAGTITFFRVSKEGKTIVALHSSLSSPYCIYLHEVGSKTVKPLTSRKYKVNLAKLAKPKPVWYESSDGVRIHAWYLHAGQGSTPYPAVIWPHGGPTSQVYDRWSAYLQSISQSGFAVLAPDFRGSTGYGSEFRDMNLCDVGGGDLEDVVAGAGWLARQHDVNKSKIAVFGHSYGGYLTLMALTKKPQVFAAGVALAPVTDWLESYELEDASFHKTDQELFGGTPKEKGELYKDRSPINFISNIRAPVLIAAGRNDPTCQIQPIEKFVRRLEEMKHPHKFIVAEKEGHVSGRVSSLGKDVKAGVNYLRKTMNVS